MTTLYHAVNLTLALFGFGGFGYIVVKGLSL